MNASGRTYPLFLLGLLLVIGVVHIYALVHSLYWKIWWLDIPMHLVGGLWVGLAACYIFFLRKGGEISQDFFRMFSIAILAILVVGIGWEIFEWSIDRFLTGRPFDPMDTGADLLNDLLGSVAAVFLFRAIHKT